MAGEQLEGNRTYTEAEIEALVARAGEGDERAEELLLELSDRALAEFAGLSQ